MNGILVLVYGRTGWKEKIAYARVPVAGDKIQVPGKGYDKTVVSVTLLPFEEGVPQASVIVED